MTAMTQQQTIAPAPDDWTSSVAFDQFDPSSGTLLAAGLTLTGIIATSVSFENLAPVAATIGLGVTGAISASAAGIGALATAAPGVSASAALPAFQGTFDGTVDFTAPSAQQVTGLTGSGTESTPLPVGTSAGNNPILGTGTFDVGVTSTAAATVTANGNYAVQLSTGSAAALSLTYVTPAQDGGGGSNGGSGVVTVDWFPNLSFWPGNYIITTGPQVDTFAPRTTGWTDTADIAQFDPSLGTLDAVIVTVGDTIAATFSAENLGSGPAAIATEETARLDATVPGQSGDVIATSTNGVAFNLGAYDGTTDFAGPSGQNAAIGDPGVTNAPATVQNQDVVSTDTLTAAASLSAFTGSGTIALPVTSLGFSTLTGPGNMEAVSTQETGGTVSVSYVYTPTLGLEYPNLLFIGTPFRGGDPRGVPASPGSWAGGTPVISKPDLPGLLLDAAAGNPPAGLFRTVPGAAPDLGGAGPAGFGLTLPPDLGWISPHPAG